jgi:voltage-gated potassium channel Kch
MLAVTFGGIFVLSTFIGLVTSGIEHKLGELRKGRSLVVEQGHTVILGWSPHVFSIIPELVLANENRPRSCIVLMADRDKVEMEDELRDKIGPTGRTRIVCRRGNPIDLDDLAIVNPNAAASFIVLSPDGEDPDSHVIKTILALTNNPGRRRDPYHIIAEMRDPKNEQVARMVGGAEAQILLVGDLIARITVQTCRQSGLSIVYTELMNFGGDEIYFQEEPRLVGRSFGDSLLAYEDSAPIGLRFADGTIKLNPPMDTRIEAGDRIIAISEDDDTIRLSGKVDHGIAESAIRQGRRPPREPERTVIIGWNRWATTILNELDNYAAPGSEVAVVADLDGVPEQIALACPHLTNQTVTTRRGDTTDRRILDSLDLPSYQRVITLGYSDHLPPQEADARTLITLLHLRDIAVKAGRPFTVVSEMLDVRNRQLAEVAQADDFIVSENLVSLLLAQVSENRELSLVFEDLFDARGSELYLNPAADYVETGRAVSFYTVVEAARRRGEVAIGYRLCADAREPGKSYGVVVNPPKSKPVSFRDEDRIIVLAET